MEVAVKLGLEFATIALSIVPKSRQSSAHRFSTHLLYQINVAYLSLYEHTAHSLTVVSQTHTFSQNPLPFVIR